MANFNQIDVIEIAEVVTQIKGMGSQMGIDISVKAPSGKTITVVEGGTIQLEWVDEIGTQILAQTLPAGTINDVEGLALGTYYPAGKIFMNQEAVNDFFTTKITAKVYKASISA